MVAVTLYNDDVVELEPREGLVRGVAAVHRAIIGFLCVVALAESPLGAEPASDSVSRLFSATQSGIARVGLKGQGGPAPGVRSWLGTGFVVDDDCTIATAKHLFNGIDMESVVVQINVLDGERPRSVVADPALWLKADASDLAFLLFPRVLSKNPCLAFDVTPLSLVPHDETALIGEEVAVLGHPAVVQDYDLRTPVLRTGRIAAEAQWQFGEAPETEMYLLDLIGVPGFSGSPVLRLATREVIAVVFGPGPTKRGFGFEWATKISSKTYGIVPRARSKLSE